jgi:putative hydrolase of the HAD superfamily
MLYTTLFFDLDDTLYNNDCGLWFAIRERMGHYMYERMGVPEEQVMSLRRHYFETYGTTLRGLQLHHQIDADEYLAYVHDLPLQEFIQPIPGLRQLVLSLPQRRWIFTNADANHARRVLSVLELEGCFLGIIDINALQYNCKPTLAAYQRAMAIAGETDPHHCVLLDDSPANLAPARKLGFTTILVGTDSKPNPAAQISLPELMALPDAMPELWRGD